ncbi:MAG: hypothetical protein LBP56_05185 [Odoribacteraceae bacterium]|jgi:hypothetical protein|nr:hypothetical protein [Odoribacteraceae bacterium]
METFELTRDSGYYAGDSGVVTFEIQGRSFDIDDTPAEYRNLYSRFTGQNMTMQLEEYTVPLWGEGHNLYPQEVYEAVSENKLLPEILQKQVEFLFGKGPFLYTPVIEGEGARAKITRVPVHVPEIAAWFESWETAGVDSLWDYLLRLTEDFYYTNSAITRYHFTRARRVPGLALPVLALSHVDASEARLATREKPLLDRPLKDGDLPFVITGDWLNPARQFEVYHRFSPAAPFAHDTAISWVKDRTPGRDVYPYNRWYRGLKPWIKASNLTPRYLNSYLKNALNAHIHVIIPGVWITSQKNTLESICRENLVKGTAFTRYYKGVKLTDESGAPVEFHEAMIEQLVAFQLRQISGLLSGEGENQGKLWATSAWGGEGWKFEEFPGNFKDYMDPVIAYDKRADQVILAGKGINASITNVENEGVISKSGSDVYYNYLIYSNALTIAEYLVTKDINRAIRLNFPRAIAENIRLGFRIEIPAKQQDTTPSDRLENQPGK